MKKRGFPGSFLLFLLVALLIFLAFHHLTEDQGGKVSFSHQVEHLVNLDLIKKEESRKIALNDNLVSFSGKFRDRLTEEAQNRFRYLELLSKNHQFVDEGKNLEQDLSLLRRHAKEA
ncbi:MAG TPA: cell division protein FtsH, partial [Parachlamydiales bacterium]|nr:cell division protein FtsH [Parachlamydiales bacterium]